MADESGASDVVKNRMLQVALVVDVSDSMQPCINNLTDNLRLIVDEIQKGEGQTTTGQGVGIDYQIAVVGHQSRHDGNTQLFVLGFKGPSEIDKVRDAVNGLAARVSGSEATLHAMDWAMDNLAWERELPLVRKFLVVFTDEPVSGGDMKGISDDSRKKFLRKLFNYSLFVVAPVESDTTKPIGFGELKGFGFCKGYQNVAGASPADWAQINFGELLKRIGKTVTTVALSEELTSVPEERDVFGTQQQYNVIRL
jgi:hypothetical protein